MNVNTLKISAIVLEYSKSLDANDAKDLLLAAVMPIVCVVIEDLVNEGKLDLC